MNNFNFIAQFDAQRRKCRFYAFSNLVVIRPQNRITYDK